MSDYVGTNERHYWRFNSGTDMNLFRIQSETDFDGFVDDVVLFKETDQCLDQGTSPRIPRIGQNTVELEEDCLKHARTISR